MGVLVEVVDPGAAGVSVLVEADDLQLREEPQRRQAIEVLRAGPVMLRPRSFVLPIGGHTPCPAIDVVVAFCLNSGSTRPSTFPKQLGSHCSKNRQTDGKPCRSFLWYESVRLNDRFIYTPRSFVRPGRIGHQVSGPAGFKALSAQTE